MEEQINILQHRTSPTEQWWIITTVYSIMRVVFLESCCLSDVKKDIDFQTFILCDPWMPLWSVLSFHPLNRSSRPTYLQTSFIPHAFVFDKQELWVDPTDWLKYSTVRYRSVGTGIICCVTFSLWWFTLRTFTRMASERTNPWNCLWWMSCKIHIYCTYSVLSCDRCTVSSIQIMFSWF